MAVWLVCLSTVVFSQNYHFGMGLKAGKTTGVTIKYFVANSHALETTAGWGDSGYRLSQMYYFHKHPSGLSNHSGWHLMIGFGIHGTYYPPHMVQYLNEERNVSYIGYGVGVGGGFEYAFRKMPFSFGFDFRPMIEVTTIQNVKPHLWDGGVFLRHNLY